MAGMTDAPFTLVLTHDVDEMRWRGMGLLSRPALAMYKALVGRSTLRLLTRRLAAGGREVGLLGVAGANRATLTVLWHNESFLPPRCWQGVYRRLLDRARADRALVITAGEAARRMRPAGCGA